jgi:four helix bundle protein
VETGRTKKAKNRKTEKQKNMTFFRFRQFPVYQAARDFRKKWKRISKEEFPKEENYGLRGQFWRALDSIILNIAEGADRYSDRDFSRFLNNAITSVNECVSCLDCALDDDYITPEEHKEGIKEAENLIRQLKSFAAKVRKE